MQQEETDRLIKRVMTGEVTSEEKAQLEKEFEQRGLGENWPQEEAPEWEPAAHQSARMLQNVLQYVQEAAPVKTLHIPLWLRGVAAALIGLVALLWIGGGHREERHKLAAVSKNRVTNYSTIAKQVMLPDGTAVWLNHRAYVEWTADSFQQNRQVWMQGEAYFEVAQDAQHPFHVHNGPLQTTVLGTSFNIEEDTMQHSVTVALLTGKVALSANGSTATTLLPGQAAVYHEREKQLSALPLPWYTLAWKTGQLTCTDEPLQEVIAYLGKHYNTPVHAQRSLQGLTFSGTLSLKEPLPVVLDRLLFVYGLRQKSTHHTIVID